METRQRRPDICRGDGAKNEAAKMPFRNHATRNGCHSRQFDKSCESPDRNTRAKSICIQKVMWVLRRVASSFLLAVGG